MINSPPTPETTYFIPIALSTQHLLGTGTELLHLDGLRMANRVRLTLENNAGGQDFGSNGQGDRVGLGEIRLAGAS